ncbi:MAG: DUF1579 domain-containing protein [Candidatus Aminicenantales bacterium]|jgi:hypothetical protein
MFHKTGLSSAARTCFAIALVLSSAIALQAQTAQDQQKAMEMYMQLGAVGENHAYLKQYVGKWKVEVTMWTFPGSPATASETAAKGELILGGRFLRMTYSGTMMGQPFEGVQTLGYDNLQKKYVSLWIDSTSTAFYQTTGIFDAAAKTMTEAGLWPDPMSGGKVKVRNVTKWLGPDAFTYETYMTLPNGKEFKSMEERAVRVK